MYSDWETTPLGQLLTLERRKAEIVPEATYKLVTLPLHGKGARLRKKVLGSELGSAKFVVRAGDLMISKIDARKGSNSLLPGSLDGAVVTGDSLSYSLDTQLVLPSYLDMVVRTPWFEELCDTVSGGTTNRVRLDPIRFLALTIMLPPLDEQRRIVDLIGSLDDAIEAADEVSKMARALRAKLLNAMLSSYPAVKIRDLVSKISGGKSPEAEGRPPGTNEFGVLKVGAVNQWGFRPKESKTVLEPEIFTDAMKVRQGDVLITRANTLEKVGAVCFVEEVDENLYLCDKTLRLVPEKHVDSWCLVSALNSSAARQQIQLAATGTSASMKNISQVAIGNIIVGWPDSPEGQRVVGMTDRSLLATIARADHHAGAVRAVRSELLSALLSGAHTILESYDELLGDCAVTVALPAHVYE